MLTFAANAMEEKEFNEFRAQIQTAAGQSPLQGISLTDRILAEYAGSLSLEQKIRLLYGKAWNQTRTNQFSTAMQTLAYCKELSLNSNDPTILFSYYSLSAGAFSNRQMYVQALEYYRKAYELAQKMPTDEFVRQTENNMGLVFLALGQYEEARKYFDLFYQNALQQKWPSAEAVGLNNLGEVALAEGNLALAERLHQQALQIRLDNKYGYFSSWSYHNLGKVALQQGQNAQALPLLEKAIAIREAQNSQSELIEPLLDYAKALSLTGQATQAETMLHRAINLASSQQQDHLLARAQQQLSALYQQQQQYELALQMQTAATLAISRFQQDNANLSLTQHMAQAGLAVVCC